MIRKSTATSGAWAPFCKLFTRSSTTIGSWIHAPRAESHQRDWVSSQATSTRCHSERKKWDRVKREKIEFELSPPTPELNQLGMTLRLPFCSLKLKLIYGWFVRSKVLQQGGIKRGLWPKKLAISLAWFPRLKEEEDKLSQPLFGVMIEILLSRWHGWARYLRFGAKTQPSTKLPLHSCTHTPSSCFNLILFSCCSSHCWNRVSPLGVFLSHHRKAKRIVGTVSSKLNWHWFHHAVKLYPVWREDKKIPASPWSLVRFNGI